MIEPTRRTVRDLRRDNRAALLRPLYLDGPLSRQELAAVSGLSQAAISTMVTDLADDGVVIEAGSERSDGGRPRILLRINPDAARVIGVDAGETGVRVELFDLALGRLAEARYPLRTGGTDPEQVVVHVLAGIGRVLAESGTDADRVVGVGIGVPGVVQHGAETLVHGQAMGWHGVPLERMLRAGTGLPLFVDNDATALGQAEMWFGAGRGCRHAVVALVGSGVGACVIAEGAPYRGATRSAGEWGHTAVRVGGRACRCGSYGCLESYVGGHGILARYAEVAGDLPPDLGPEAALAWLLDTTSPAATSPAATEVVADTVRYLGAGIANLVNLFNPERIVLGGWAGLLLGERLMPQIRAAAAAHALRHPYAHTTVELCRIGPDAVAFGAATLPVAAFLAGGGTLARNRPAGARR
jgi:predicted NBD/HSP70 family sugar kinase